MRRHTRIRRARGALLALGCGVLAAGCASATGPGGGAAPRGAAAGSPADGATDRPSLPPSPTVTAGPSLAGTAGTAGSAGSAGPAASDPSDECARGQLSIDVGQPFGVSAGTSYGDVVLTNVSHATCWVQGSASVVPLDAQRRVVPVTLTEPSRTAARVVLAPGSAASEVLGYGSDGNPVPGQSSCGPEEDYFEVTLPGTAEGVEVPGWHREKCESDDIVTSNLVSGASARP